MTIDADAFRSLLGRFASGITIVTTVDHGGRDVGMTVSAFASVSLSPPLVLTCVAREASVFFEITAAPRIVVNILAEGQESLSRRFAGPAWDRFEGLGVRRAPGGAPILDEVLAWCECRVVQRHDAGDHVILVAEVEGGEVRDEKPLLYYRGGYAQLRR
ncbi:MAG: flavin reductase family protein [Gemmatimonadetes bacterium]|nr:flavin reductase family protein [Gemmatimonadota bacterium]